MELKPFKRFSLQMAAIDYIVYSQSDVFVANNNGNMAPILAGERRFNGHKRYCCRLIDTAVVGNSSSLELAALGPRTVLCDQFCYIFMFLFVATSNLVATAFALKKREEATEHLSRLLFVSLACGVGMFCFTYFGATALMTAFVGAKNAALVPAALPYVQIRAFAWPAILVGMVAQSASPDLGRYGVSCWDVLGFVRDLLHLVSVVPVDPRFACAAFAKVGQGSP